LSSTPTGKLPPTPAYGDEIPVTLTPLPTATAVPPLTISAEEGVPSELIAAAQQITRNMPQQFQWADNAAEADIILTLRSGEYLASWVYVVAAPFATVEDDVTLAEVIGVWQGRDPSNRSLFASAETAGWDTATISSPIPSATFLYDITEMRERAWAERPSLLILPFHQLTPDLKLLSLDGQSPLTPQFDPVAYPLTVVVNVVGKETAVSASSREAASTSSGQAVSRFLAAWDGPITNWDSSKLTRVAMSGVTALTRATAFQMEIGGILTPGQAVGRVLKTADIAHVSNEVSFVPNCPYPNPVGGTAFCSRESYFELLTSLGIDVVELTGNHINDWGTDGLLYSLDLYANAGMAVFGGGADGEAAQQPAIFSHNGNQIAFLGCNPVGPAYAWAGSAKPGSRSCDATFEAQIAQLAAEGYLVIATLQYNEFYHYGATAQQRVDFAALAAAGATAVSGSQGHHAQGFAFVDGVFIHYGLGNLFFDQMDRLGTRQTFVDTYVFYDGRLLSVELWTGLIENFCCPREMTAAERAAALTAVFQASDW
jgi:poly-gamma-glutamate synthesis protein (capsule biosynthesis protein)